MQVIVQNLAVSYEDKGAGPVVLMMHGWGSDLRVFERLSSSLSGTHRVVCFDWPGFGGSQTPPASWGIADFAAFTKAFCQKLGIEPAVLIGHSMGGQVAVHLAGTKLIQPQKIILIGASAVRPPKTLRTRTFWLVAKAGKLLVGSTPLGARLRKRLYKAAGTEDYLGNPQMQEIYGRIVNPREDQRELAARIDVPVLLLWGDADRDTPLERGRLLQSALPQGRLEVFSGAGHYVMLDDPAGVERNIKEFLK